MGWSHYAHARHSHPKASSLFLGQLADGSGEASAMWASLVVQNALKVNMKQCNVDLSALSSDTQDRSAWKTLCHEAVNQFEDSQVEALKHKRAVRKGAQPSDPSFRQRSLWRCIVIIKVGLF